jgi:hypothetical protein
MMQNSCIFIFIVAFLLMRTAIDRSNDLPRVIAGIAGRAEDSNLASIPTTVGTEQAPPMPLLSPSPQFGFGVRDRVLHLFLGVARPTGHCTTSI